MRTRDLTTSPCRRSRESGQAMVEFALILFPLLVIVAGIIQFGIALNYWLDMQRIANQGARWAAVNCTRSATTPPSYNPCNPDLQTTLRQQALANGLQAVSLRRDYVPVRLSAQGRPREGLPQDALQTRSAPRNRHDQARGRRDDADGVDADGLLIDGRVSMTRAAAARERGQVVVMFALLIPVFFGLGAIVLDIGNWYVHKRHLQTQVDAAVLAAGPAFVGCYHAPSAANQAIAQTALQYAGDTLRAGTTTNTQIEQPNDVRIALNSSRYWQKTDGVTSPTNGYGLDNSMATPGDPCSTKILDAKATDDDAPSLWGLIPLTPSPKTKAKIEIRKLESESGMLPWAVPEIDPRTVWALFVNEDNGAVFDSQELVLSDDPNLPWSEWATKVDGTNERLASLDVTRTNTGVVILVSKENPTPTVTGSLASICSQSPNLVNCYAGNTATSGATFIHAYNGGGGGTREPGRPPGRARSSRMRSPARPVGALLHALRHVHGRNQQRRHRLRDQRSAPTRRTRPTASR